MQWCLYDVLSDQLLISISILFSILTKEVEMRSFVTLAMTLFCLEAHAELYGGYNHPANFNKVLGTSVVTELENLPLSGKLSDDRMGWSESYWPSNKGGIAYRWNHPNPEPFKYKLYSQSELKRMNQIELGQLSPAELYDISQGDYSYTLTRKVLGMYSPRDLWWEGICHGWAQAAANFPEPDQIVIGNRDGIQVPFGSSDVKALLAMHDAYNYQGATSAFVGKRCKVNGKVEGEGSSSDTHPNPPSTEEANHPDCRDVNAGTFHIVITNAIGIHSKGFVADVDRFNDVWNQPVTDYTSQIVGEEPLEESHHSTGIVRRVRVKTKMVYGEELMFYSAKAAEQGYNNFVSKLPVTNTPHQEYRHKDYEYILELDSAGRIQGGEWISETRPDFMWLIARHKRFQNSPIPLKGLNNIYRPLRR
jgi:hypothetical protein